jgi:hypothetical protein
MSNELRRRRIRQEEDKLSRSSKTKGNEKKNPR